MVQYDLNSNYAKCSQVPLVNAEACTGSGALLGFFTYSTGTPGQQLMTGTPICSTKHHNTTPAGLDSAGIRGGTEKRTVKAIDCSGSGYVKRIKNDEKPECVSSSAPRVAAEHRRPSEWRAEAVVTKNYTVEYLADPGPPARYASTPNNCTITRYKAVKSFSAGDGSPDSSGKVSYLDYHNTFGTDRGEQGLRGTAGEDNGPRGPPGRCGYPYCCRYVYETRRRIDWYRDRNRNWRWRWEYYRASTGRRRNC